MMNATESKREYMYMRGERKVVGVKSYRLSIGNGLLMMMLVLVICIELWVIGFGLANKLRSRGVIGEWVVRVSGCSDEDAMDMQRRVEMYLKGRDIFFDIGGLRRYLESWRSFSELKIKKELSGVVNIEAKKREPFAYLISGGGWVLDERGEVIGDISKFRDGIGSSSLPVIYAEEVDRREDVVKKGIKVIKEIRRHEGDGVGISLLRYEGDEKAFYIGLGGVILEVSEEGVVEEMKKYYKYRDEIGKMVQRGQVLDLRFRGQVIIKQEERIGSYGKTR